MSEHPCGVLRPFALPCLQVFTLQEALQSSRTIPIIRHTRSALCPCLFQNLFQAISVFPSCLALPALSNPHPSAGPVSALFCARWSDAPL